MRTSLLMAAVASLALAACGTEPEGTAPSGLATDAELGGMDEATADANAPITAEDAAVPQGAQAFVDNVASSDMFEVESSRLAATMAKSQAVKDFASMMVKEHTQSSTELKSLTGAMTPPIAVSPSLDPTQEADLAALRTAGENFDRLYLEKQIVAHEKALALVRGYADNGTVEPLKGFASKAATKIEGHLKQVRAIKP